MSLLRIPTQGAIVGAEGQGQAQVLAAAVVAIVLLFLTCRSTGNGQEQPDVCGGISVINIMGGKSDGRDRTDEAGARHRTRSSWHLGQWVVRNAARKEVSDGRAKRGATVMSDANIYLEQDLYCLSSSAGSDFQPWPRRAHSPHSERYRKKAERMNPAKSEKDLSNTMHASRIELPSMGKEIAKLSDTLAPLDLNYISMSNSTRPGTPDSGLTSLSSVTVVAVPKKHVGQKSEIYSYGCLRKVVLRGPPYQLVVDRRCVWKLCPANNFGDTNELSAKEKVAHKLLRSAEEGLEASKQNREGGRVYDKVVLDGQPLHGGEKFSRNLRSILSQHGFKKETQQLNLRRKQEKLIESHFHGLYESGNGWPEGMCKALFALPRITLTCYLLCFHGAIRLKQGENSHLPSRSPPDLAPRYLLLDGMPHPTQVCLEKHLSHLRTRFRSWRKAVVDSTAKVY